MPVGVSQVQRTILTGIPFLISKVFRDPMDKVPHPVENSPAGKMLFKTPRTSVMVGYATSPPFELCGQFLLHNGTGRPDKSR